VVAKTLGDRSGGSASANVPGLPVNPPGGTWGFMVAGDGEQFRPGLPIPKFIRGIRAVWSNR
jgi:hypothetical protein